MSTKRMPGSDQKTLATKRGKTATRPLWIIRAVTRTTNKHRAATATAIPEDLDEPEHASMMSRGLIIMFGIHIVAIAAYFFHVNHLNKHTDALSAATPAARSAPVAAAPPLIKPGDRTVAIARGDTYATLAASEGVTEQALRAANNDCALRAGDKLIVPPAEPVRITAALPPAIEAIRNPQAAAPEALTAQVTPEETIPRATVVSDAELVDVSPAPAPRTTAAAAFRPVEAGSSRTVKQTVKETAPRATPAATRQKTAVAKAAPPKTTPVKVAKATPKAPARAVPVSQPKATSRGGYTVAAGDNLYQISKKLKVSQAALMKANGISDPRKLRTGATLKVP